MKELRLPHTLMGCVLSAVAYALSVLTDPNMLTEILYSVLFALGLLWALFIGSAGGCILFTALIPIAAIQYFLIPPIKLRSGNAVEGNATIVAYCVYPDRIIVVREFPSDKSLQGDSYFLTNRIRRKTLSILEKSSAKEIEIDETIASSVLNETLPDLNEIDPKSTDRSIVDNLHRTVDRLWKSDRTAEQSTAILHLAGWYALLADRYWNRDKRTWLDHAMI